MSHINNSHPYSGPGQPLPLIVTEEAQVSDIPEIKSLITGSVKSYFANYMTEDQVNIQAAGITEDQHIESYLRDGVLIIARKKDDIVGCGGLKVTGHLAWFGLGYVSQEKEGIGSALMEARFDWLLERADRWWLVSERHIVNKRAADHLTRHGFQCNNILRPSGRLAGQDLDFWVRSLVRKED